MNTDLTKIQHMRDAFVAAVIDLAAKDPNVVLLDADLASCVNSGPFEAAYPDRFFNCGIAEANMVGMAAGLSSMGLVPFAHTFACFASRRVYDQWFLSANYAKRCVHLVGTDPGVTAQLNGGTHMPFEDIALMRQIPNLTIVEPSDTASCYALTEQVYGLKTSSYMRLQRKGTVLRYDVGQIELGKGIVREDGDDVTIIAAGLVMVEEAVKAQKTLAAEGISAAVIDMHTIKPLDTDLILKYAKKTGRVLVCENGRIAGGLGSGVAEFLARNLPVPMDFVCVEEDFGEVGSLKYLMKRFGLTEADIVAKAKGLMAR